MFTAGTRMCVAFVVLIALTCLSIFTPLPRALAADHAESTSVAGDPGADIADVFAFLDPADNTKVILAMDFEGFIVPSEAANLGFFSPEILYRFEIENTGDAITDTSIDVTFTPQTSRSVAQTAQVVLPPIPGFIRQRSFTAPTTVQTLNAVAPPFVVTNNAIFGVSFYAGLTD